MTIEIDVEWDDEKGEYNLIEKVEFEAEPFWQDDSFSYAGTHCTGGVGGVHRVPLYHTLEDRDITWDKSKYTQEENNSIQAYVEKNFDNLEEKFCDQLRKETTYHCDY